MSVGKRKRDNVCVSILAILFFLIDMKEREREREREREAKDR